MSLAHKTSHPTPGKDRISIPGLFLLLVLVAGCGGTAPPPQTPPPQFTSIDLGLPPAALSAPVIGPLPASTLMHVGITLKANQQLLAQLSQRKVQSGQTLNLETEANKLGIDEATYQKFKSFFGIDGATLKLSKLHTNLTIDARASTFARLFQTSFVIHKLNNHTFYAPTSNPKLPILIAAAVIAITGLDTYTTLQHGHSARRLLKPSSRSAGNCRPIPGSLAPGQVAHAYGFDQLWQQGFRGEGMTINLIELDGFNQQDIQNYFDCLHFQGNLKVVNVNTPPKTVELESTLDIETIAGLAPTINIVDYQGPNTFTEFNDEFQQILNDNTRNTTSGSVVSISWGAAEDQMTSSDMMALDQSMELLATAVGGTVLKVDGAGNRSSEVAWSDGSNHRVCNNQWGSGGGLSTIFKRPSWQDGQVIQNRYANGTRQLRR